MCKLALRQRLHEILPNIEWIYGFSGYVKELTTNFVSGVTAELYEGEFLQGAGGELNWGIRNGKKCPPKMCAAHSSSALVVNSFAPWKLHLKELTLCGYSAFCSLHFETRAPTGLGGTPPHLDFLAQSVADNVVATESKATEYLEAHRTDFVPSYSAKCWPSGVEPYVAMMRELQTNPSRFVHLDAAQLVKHGLGLASRVGQHEVTLLYLFWEPENCDSYSEFGLHRKEVEQFARAVIGASIKFSWKTYLELWHEWERTGSSWLQLHASELLRRYAVRI